MVCIEPMAEWAVHEALRCRCASARRTERIPVGVRSDRFGRRIVQGCIRRTREPSPYQHRGTAIGDFDLSSDETGGQHVLLAASMGHRCETRPQRDLTVGWSTTAFWLPAPTPERVGAASTASFHTVNSYGDILYTGSYGARRMYVLVVLVAARHTIALTRPDIQRARSSTSSTDTCADTPAHRVRVLLGPRIRRRRCRVCTRHSRSHPPVEPGPATAERLR